MAKFILSAKGTRELDALRAAIEEKFEALQEAYEQARGMIEAASDAYDEAVNEAHEFVSNQADEWQGFFDDRSEQWQEGDAGQAAQDLIYAWQEMEAGEIDRPDLECPADAYGEALDALPREIDQ